MKANTIKFRNCLTILLILISGLTFAQVGINTINPAEGSMLDVSSSEKGVFIPRVNIVNLNNIDPITGVTTPANASGLLVYNSNTSTGPGFFVWNGGNWEIVGDNNDDWKRSGNSGTTGTDFIGTTDGQPLLFKTNNSNRFEITANGRLRAYNSGSQVQPSYSWNNSTSTGMFRPDNNQLGFTTDGNERLRIDANGLIGINNNNVLSRLHIKESTNTQGPFYSEITNSNSNWSAVEAYNPKISNGAGILGTGFYGAYGQSTNPLLGWAGYFNGDLNVTGSYYNMSDKRWKKDINSLGIDKNIINKVMLLNPKTYKWKASEFPGMNFDPNKTSYGFIAQELKEVFPDLVVSKGIPDPKQKVGPYKSIESVDGYYMVEYTGLIPILTEAIQEQQKKITSLEQRIEALEKVMGKRD